MKQEYLKIIDVNFNRAKEGLRVVEEILRFCLGNRTLTNNAKNTRHKLVAIFKNHKISESNLNMSRNITNDVGRYAQYLEKKSDLSDVFFANIHRSQEALRVLEEISSLFSFSLFKQLKNLRFKIYALEKKSLEKLKILSHC